MKRKQLLIGVLVLVLITGLAPVAGASNETKPMTFDDLALIETEEKSVEITDDKTGEVTVLDGVNLVYVPKDDLASVTDVEGVSSADAAQSSGFCVVHYYVAYPTVIPTHPRRASAYAHLEVTDDCSRPVNWTHKLQENQPFGWSTRDSRSLTTYPGETIPDRREYNCGDTDNEQWKNWTTGNYTTRHLACDS